MASSKDIFEANIFEARIFGSGLFRGVGAAAAFDLTATKFFTLRNHENELTTLRNHENELTTLKGKGGT